MALKNWVPQVRNAFNQALSDHIVITQGKLAKACPKDTGRMASSFYIGKNQPDLSVRPENWADKGTEKVNIPKYSQEITADGDWYISNNLKYSERVGYNPIWAKGGAGGSNWYTNITSQQSTDFQKRLTQKLRKIK